MIDFNKLIDQHLQKEMRNKDIGRYYPSEIGTCLRKVWYSYKFPQETKGDLLKVFEIGNIIHDFVVDVLESEKTPEIELVESETPFKMKIDDFVISGRIDNLIVLKDENKKVLVEVKSTGDIGYVTKPSPHNVIQLQLYMYQFGIHDGILLYVDKKNLQSRVFTVPYSEEEALKVIDRFKKLDGTLKKDILPDPEGRMFKDMNWMCRFCEYRDKCYEATPKEILD